MRNRTRGTVVAARCEVANSFLTRGLGLIPRSGLAAGEGLLITKTGSITMLFMRFAIDALFLDRSLRVLRVAEGLRPWVPAVGAPRGTDSVLELPAGTAARTGTQAGDELISSTSTAR
ncbi:MAG: DUF192 domain-containing protein [Chloroflexi bacterium]|nr:MAG: DUF192 domain-containing protein [Chloroflexota bacterium]TME72424.1 MAG: DUF192 domain-containing protein [Chloroflexota bacterium]TMG53501.1 MAG: DUF192 domain-containing protein [Chloroflexota bacterium]